MTARHARTWDTQQPTRRAVHKEGGYTLTPCPACGQRVQPGEPCTYLSLELTIKGTPYPWHVGCASGMCPYCGTKHAAPYDGGCLL